jgi:hypothetical protein
MVSFKDQLNKDLDIFLNTNEFGELHKLGSTEIKMVIEEDSFNQLSGRNDEVENTTQNLYESVTTIYLKASDYKKPSIGKRVTLDDEKYYVIGASVSDGILKINLAANESYG